MQALKNIFYVFFDNIDYFGVLILFFVAAVCLVYAITTYLLRNRTEEEARLSKLVSSPHSSASKEPEKLKFLGKEHDGFTARISRPLQRMISLDDRTVRNKMRLRLIQAGYHSDSAVYTYLASKVILIALFIGLYLVTRVFYKIAADTLLSIVLLAALGYVTPSLWVWLMTLARKERIFKGLPDALDLMVVCVESGLGLDMTFKRVGEEVRPLCKDLSDEFNLTTLEIRAGKSREEAFKNMTTRTGVPEVNNLMTVLAQTSRFGTSLATALRIHADAMRVKRRQIAEETAAKATVKLIFPLVLFIFPAIFVVLIGPGAIKIVKHLFPVLGG